MIRGSFIFTLCLLIVSVVLLFATQSYPLKAKIFPMIAIGTAVILLVIQTIVDIMASRKEVPSGKEKGERFGRKHLSIGVWMVATLLMLWILGFIGTVMFLPFLYLRLSRESWKLSIILSLSCGLFFYVLFGLALKMPLYPGILFGVFSS
jgi:hypothetical protein